MIYGGSLYLHEFLTFLKKTLIIGDSLSADFLGGQAAGIDICWFNPIMKLNNTDIVPTYQIQKLDELYQILKLELKVV